MCCYTPMDNSWKNVKIKAKRGSAFLLRLYQHSPCIQTHTHTYMHTYYMHTYMHTYIHSHMNACIHTYIHTYCYIHTYTYMNTFIRTHTHSFTHKCMHAYRHTYIHTVTYIHTHSFIHAYVHTHIHSHMNACIIQTYTRTCIRTNVGIICKITSNQRLSNCYVMFTLQDLTTHTHHYDILKPIVGSSVARWIHVTMLWIVTWSLVTATRRRSYTTVLSQTPSHTYHTHHFKSRWVKSRTLVLSLSYDGLIVFLELSWYGRTLVVLSLELVVLCLISTVCSSWRLVMTGTDGKSYLSILNTNLLKSKPLIL